MQHLYRPPTWHPRPPTRRWLPPPSAASALYGFDLDDAALDLEFGNVSGTLVDLALATSVAVSVAVYDPDDPTAAVWETTSTTHASTGRLPRLENAALAGQPYIVTVQTTDVDPLDRSIASFIMEATLP